MIEVKAIQRYKGKSVASLLKIAERHFNTYIRKRDAGKPCVSCGQRRTLEAGHYYPKTVSALRFHENNVHGQCNSCNRHGHGNLASYLHGLLDRIGQDGLNELMLLKEMYDRAGYKWDRFHLIEIIEKYKAK